MTTLTTFDVRENGKNSQVAIVEVQPTGLARTLKSRVWRGKDDTQFIPFKSISHTQLDRKHGWDVLTVFVGTRKFEWKGADVEALNEAINQAIS